MMYEQENQRVTHLIILLCYTIFTIVLTGESILLGWDMEAVMLYNVLRFCIYCRSFLGIYIPYDHEDAAASDACLYGGTAGKNHYPQTETGAEKYKRHRCRVRGDKSQDRGLSDECLP